MERERNQKRPSRSAPKKRNSPAARMARELRRERAAEQASAQQPERSRSEERSTRVAPKKRTSRGATEAQRRREDRREQARLDGLRDRQKRQAKQRTRRRISPDAWKHICIMGAVVVAVVLTMVIFFRVHDVQVSGNHFYAMQEVVDAAGISEGDNLLTLSRGEIAGNIIAKLPYVKSVRVNRKLPDTVVLHITEYDATFAVRDVSGAYYLITAAGKVTQQVEEREAKLHVLITQPQIQKAAIGETITLPAVAGQETETQNLLSALLSLLQELEAAELTKSITSIELSSAYQLVVWYDDRFEVRLGTGDQLAYKLEYLKVAMAQQEDYASGVIDLTLNEGNQARIILNE